MRRQVVVPLVVALAAALGVGAGAGGRALWGDEPPEAVAAGDPGGADPTPTSPTEPAPTGPTEPTPTEPAPPEDPYGGREGEPLFWADDVIHDGDLRVDYRAPVIVDKIARTAYGWVLVDSGADGWIQLVSEQGETVAVQDADLATDFDVSADGEEIVVPGPEDNEVTIASTLDGSRIATLDADLRVARAYFVGERVVAGGIDRQDDAGALGEIHIVDRDESVTVLAPEGETLPFWRLVGVHDESGIVLTQRGTDADYPETSEQGELMAFDIDQPRRPLWRTPDLSPQGEGLPSLDYPQTATSAPDPFSPDGSRIAVLAYTGGLSDTRITVLDARTGGPAGAVVRTKAYEFGWVDDARLLISEIVNVEIGGDSQIRAVVCEVGGGCNKIIDRRGDIAPGG